ncbi:MAG: 50S ribosomal protein L10 [Acidimicrobiia bacterium]
MARPEKTAAVDEIRTRLTESDAAVLTEYRGLTVPELAELRGALRSAGTEYKVFKNTLARLAVTSAGLEDLLPMLNGPTAIAFVTGDAVMAAKALRDFGKANQSLVIKGGLLGPKVLAPEDIAALAEVEPREVLLARLAGGFQAPLVKAAGLFQAFTRNFAYGLKAYVDQRVEGGEALEAPAADAAPVPEAVAPAADAPEAAAAEDAPEAAADTETDAAGDTPADETENSTPENGTEES